MRLVCTPPHAAWAWLLLAALALHPAVAAPQLQTGAGAVGGLGSGDINAGCTTYGPPALVQGFFGSGYGLSLPAGGIAACGYFGQWTEKVSSAGTSVIHAAVGPVLLGNPGFAGSYTGSADAQAEFTALRVGARGVYTGGLPGGPTAISDASGVAFLSDTLTLSSPQVALTSPGFVAYRFEFDGSLTALGAPAPFYFGEALASLAFQHNGGPVYSAAQAYARRGELGTATSGGVFLSGWAGSVGSVSGSGRVSTLGFLAPFPVVFGQAWDLKLGLAVRAYGESSGEFMSTARLVGLDVFDAAGVRLDQFSLSAASGTSYLAPVHEPASALLLLCGLALVGAAARHRQASPVRTGF